jgi:ABC-type uncharacterized transport system permease subunit
MAAELARITVFCFAASYGSAFALELFRLLAPRPSLRWAAILFAGAGLIAHSIYILVHPLPLQTSFGSLIFLAWILAVFCVYGTVHHGGLAWSLFVLPVVLALLGLAAVFSDGSQPQSWEASWEILSLQGKDFWPIFHGLLMLLAAVGVSVAFVASVMYLVQTYRLKTKHAPGQGLRLWSLERLETMNRRAIYLSFPLLTCGLLVAGVETLRLPQGAEGLENVKVLSTVALWIVFAILLYLRHGTRARGRQLAYWTIAAFSLMLFALISVHPFAPGGPP